MGKLDGKFDEFAGKAKRKVGDATDNERLQAEGASQEAKGEAKQAREHVKDAAHDVKRTFTD